MIYRWSGFFAGAILIALTSIGQTAAAYELPTVLSEADSGRYQEIFLLQDDGKWRAADKLITQLDNPILMGHVLFQRYMHPTAYRSKFSELRDWLAKYNDHPDADRIYNLALKRKPKGSRGPKAPVGEVRWSSPGESLAKAPAKSLSKSKHSRKRQLQRAINRYVGNGWPTKSLEILEKRETQGLFHVAETAKARSDIAKGYYVSGVNEKALDQAKKAIAEAPDHAGNAYWYGGLAAWRLGRYADAAALFEGLATAKNISSWNRAAGAFWAARSHLRDRKPEKVNEWLEVAVRQPRSFYGILAKRALGFALEFEWALPELTPRHLSALQASAPAQRGFALLQIGEMELAEAEFLRVRGNEDAVLAEALLAVADAANLPGLSLKVGERLEYLTGRTYDAAIFPLPHWHPDGGYTVDRALIFAFMRQESRFDAGAKSSAGARGLMQIMPGTASFVTGDRSLKRGRGRNRLFDPEFNIALGQQYLRHLLELGGVDNNLFRLATAYNGGPGNLQKWENKVEYNGDPLLFIESIPSRETRTFIERVISNLWIYRQRLGQPVPSLDLLAAGDWPAYRVLGNGTKMASAPK